MTKTGGLADSPFFRQPQPTEVSMPSPEKTAKKAKPKPKRSLKQPVNRDTVIPRHRDTNRDTMTPRYHDAIIEAVRKAVKGFGKEAATYRFTVDEKKAIADIIYTYSGQRVKTNGNEITRIALNFIISDYEENGENSVLHKVIKALNS